MCRACADVKADGAVYQIIARIATDSKAASGVISLTKPLARRCIRGYHLRTPDRSHRMRFCRFVLPALLIVLSLAARAADVPPVEANSKIAFTTDTLDNGLHVIYVPLHQAPVVHVRVLYHVG